MPGGVETTLFREGRVFLERGEEFRLVDGLVERGELMLDRLREEGRPLTWLRDCGGPKRP